MNSEDLIETSDAKVWAKEWLKAIGENPSIPTNEAAMVEWFENAIMAGYDSCYHKYKLAMTEDPYVELSKNYSELVAQSQIQGSSVPETPRTI